MITAADRQLRTRGIAVIDGFLDAAECESMREELDFAFWRPSRIVNRDFGDELIYYRSPQRTSLSTDQQWFSTELTELVESVERRACDLLGIDPLRLEQWQAVRYRNRGRFRLHHDAGLFAGDPEGEREVTVLLYLQTPSEGGDTVFPDLRMRVSAVAGRLSRGTTYSPTATSTLPNAMPPSLCGEEARRFSRPGHVNTPSERNAHDQ